MIDQHTVHDVINSVEEYLLERFDNYKLNEEENNNQPTIKTMKYSEFLLSMLQLLIALEDAKYLRLFTIERIYFTQLEMYPQTNLVIRRMDTEQINLLDTEEDTSKTIIQTIMSDMRAMSRGNSRVSSFFRRYNTRKNLSFANNDLFRPRHEWMEIVTSEYLIHSDEDNPSNIVSEFIDMNKRNNNHQPYIYQLYGTAVEKYLEYKYKIPVFYPFGLNKLGSGSFGSVYQLGNDLVVKKVTISSSVSQLITEQISPEYIRETSILQHIDNKCSYLIHGFAYNSSPLSRTIVMEYGGINLDTFFKDMSNISEFTMTSIMYQILSALEFLEVNYILHGDIKADNVTIQVKENGDITVKLIDLGLSCIWNYFCEEYATKRLITAPKEDIWNVGIMFHRYITGENTYTSHQGEDDRIYTAGRYDRLYSFIEENMLVSVDERSYASQLLGNRLFDLILDRSIYSEHNTVLLKYRSLNDDQVNTDINSVSSYIKDTIEYLIKWTEMNYSGVYFDSLRLSFILFSMSYSYIADIQSEVYVNDLLIICYILAHNYFGHELLDLNSVENLVHSVVYQMHVLTAVDYNFIFYDKRTKDEYFAELDIDWVLDIVDPLV